MILKDKKTNGKERPWKIRKEQTIDMAYGAKYAENLKLFERIKNCGTYLKFDTCPSGHEKKLKKANFCKHRLCPMCSWRRSLKTALTTNEIASEVLSRKPTFQFLFLTLTVPNVTGNDLPGEVDHLLKSWKKLTNKPIFKKSIRGGFRALEVTRNNDPASKNFGTFHPHIHALLVVPSGYFKKTYISRNTWLDLWRNATGYSQITQVDVRKAKDTRKKENQQTTFELASVVAEVSKYATDYKFLGSKTGQLSHKDKKDSDGLRELFLTLLEALKGKRLQSYFGIMKEIKKELSLKSGDETDDLINIDQEAKEKNVCSVCELELIKEVYSWNPGSYDYYKVVKEG